MKSSNLSDSPQQIFPIYSLNKFSRLIGISKTKLNKIAQNTNDYYKPFESKKGSKPRRIARPVGILKEIQSRINKNILSRYDFPVYFVGGIKGRSGKEHLTAHVKKKVVITVDIENCFPSITCKRVFYIWTKLLGCSPDVAYLATKLVTWEGGVPLGAPTSNLIAALAIVPCLEKVEPLLKDEGMEAPTQWVDDTAISGKSYSNKLISDIACIFADNGFKISRRKVKIMRAHSAQNVINKNVNSKISIPRKKRDNIKSAIHALSLRSDRGEDYIKEHRSVRGRVHYTKQHHPKLGEKFLKSFNALPT